MRMRMCVNAVCHSQGTYNPVFWELFVKANTTTFMQDYLTLAFFFAPLDYQVASRFG